MLPLFQFTIRQTLWQRKVWLSLLLFSGPAALALLIRILGDEGDFDLEHAWQMFNAPATMILFMLSLPLTCMLHGTALLGSEVEGRTIIYLFTRRLGRKTVFLVRFAAVAVAVTLLASVAITVLCVVSTFGIDIDEIRSSAKNADLENWQPLANLLSYLSILPMAVVAYLSIFCAIGVTLPRPLGASLSYLMILEIIVGNLPLPLRNYSVLHQVRLEMIHSIPGILQFFGPSRLRDVLFAEDARGLLNLGIVAGVAILLTCLRVSRGEMLPHKVARE